MAFAGTTQKCMACDKTVYLVDKLTADNRIYHKTCFRCHHCRGTLKVCGYFEACIGDFGQDLLEVTILSRVCSWEIIILLMESYTAGLTSISSSRELEALTKALKKPVTSKVSNSFAGTREKCVGCSKTVYPIERVTVNGTPYHKICFKCTYGGCVISPSNYIAHEGKLYCKHHHTQLIKEKGNLSQLENDPTKSVADSAVVAGLTAAEA
ncbi:Pollen-specific protein SF3 [Platanthera zijinensis]|uniref:Pollen-specific protein SF3 n=1 Tax=Platanthera zijinensis TaxID=2320716 RepID=A0AAP0GB78_9ASPA